MNEERDIEKKYLLNVKQVISVAVACILAATFVTNVINHDKFQDYLIDYNYDRTTRITTRNREKISINSEEIHKLKEDVTKLKEKGSDSYEE